MDSTTLAQRQVQFGGYLLKGYPTLGLPAWPMASACAGVGNGTQENICRPTTPGVKDHGSNGVMQWRLDRLTQMQGWCVKNFGRWDTLEAQAAFFMYECKTSYPDLYRDLLAGTKTIPTLTADICSIYERPAAASAMLDKRIQYAEDAHALLVKPPSIPVAPTSSTSSKITAGTVVVTAGGAALSHASGLPHWATAAILGLGLLFIFILAAIEANRPHPPEPTK